MRGRRRHRNRAIGPTGRPFLVGRIVRMQAHMCHESWHQGWFGASGTGCRTSSCIAARWLGPLVVQVNLSPNRARVRRATSDYGSGNRRASSGSRVRSGSGHALRVTVSICTTMTSARATQRSSWKIACSSVTELLPILRTAVPTTTEPGHRISPRKSRLRWAMTNSAPWSARGCVGS